jgi:hypothetical protein
LQGLVRRFAGTRVLVIGDLMLDQFVWGDVSRISPEAPVPIVRVRRQEGRPGGAGNVVTNVVALGGRADACGSSATTSRAARSAARSRGRRRARRRRPQPRHRHDRQDPRHRAQPAGRALRPGSRRRRRAARGSPAAPRVGRGHARRYRVIVVSDYGRAW